MPARGMGDSSILFMNIHAPPKEIRDFYRCMEWRGRRFTRNGKTYFLKQNGHVADTRYERDES